MTESFDSPPEAHKLPPQYQASDLPARLWLDALEASDQMLIAGLKASLPPGGDWREAYRQWYAEYCREHTEMLERMALRLDQAEQRRGTLPPREAS